MVNRRIDPEPFSVVGAVAGVVGAAIGAIGLWQKNHPKLPSVARRQLMKLLDVLDAELRYLQADLSEIEEIFDRSEFVGERAVRLGNGVLMEVVDFERYMQLSDSVFGRIRSINSTTLKIEKLSLELNRDPDMQATQYTDDAIEGLRSVLISQNLSVSETWSILNSANENARKLSRLVRNKLVHHSEKI